MNHINSNSLPGPVIEARSFKGWLSDSELQELWAKKPAYCKTDEEADAWFEVGKELFYREDTSIRGYFRKFRRWLATHISP